MSIEYKGWRLYEEEIREPDNIWHWHEAQHEDGRRVILHVSPYHGLFDFTLERFAYLVDHNFPRAAKGNWFSKELDDCILAEHYKVDAADQSC